MAGVKSMVRFLDDGLPVRAPQVHQVPAGPPPAAVVEGWHGVGPPRKARHMGGDKPFCDGGGLCSPGRWQPGKRRLPSALPCLRARLVEQFEKAARKSSGGADDALAFMLKLAAGRVKTCPIRRGRLGGDEVHYAYHGGLACVRGRGRDGTVVPLASDVRAVAFFRGPGLGIRPGAR